ncbi:MAG: MoxR family ATPase [Holophagales bacterium]|nr:MoxR family ATPase [Holophagales bacterium]MXX61171.1 MoxR family ATPase [Holophagales bacterium]MXX74272.1 MoxR family ATPase [Holophagales bacterium]MYA09231.1 MoxR family ATPase [Holophagales bacterium]MYC11663.1 MoxR family ATPase [Holophagales bacterium]
MSFHAFTGTDTYLASPELRDSVNVASALEKPLLVRGEPGTGKTVLAEAIAENLVMELLTWNIKSTSKAQEGLYVYDTVQRLNDARFGDRDITDISQYIKYGPLGESFLKDQRVVLLIDEIDKADMEFPNDLLHELDRMSFFVHETGEQHAARFRPIVVITSNNEKELPDAFLRRCVFHYIAFPDKAEMEDIIRVHHPDVEDELLRQVLLRFYWLRDLPELRKKPSTSELIDWIAALRRGGVSTESIESELPFLGVLMKRENDLEAVMAAHRRGRVN